MLKVKVTPPTHPKRVACLIIDGRRKNGFTCNAMLTGQAMDAKTTAFDCVSYTFRKSISTFGDARLTSSAYSRLRCKSDAHDHSIAHYLKSDSSDRFFRTTINYLIAFYEFCRPHTIFGTVAGVASVSLLPVKTAADISPLLFIELLKALVPALFMNIYIVGLNQICDIEIDKVNKPSLPLASGELNIATGATLVILSLIMSLYLGVKSGSPPLFSALFTGFLLGTAYSIEHPLLRWKRHAFLAASCIIFVRAIIIQLCFYAHMQVYVLKRPLALTKSVIFATAFMCFFSVVIALFKDIPDVKGDKYFGIESFSVRLGQKRVFWLCIELLLAAYGIAILVGASSPHKYRRIITIIGHGILASILLVRARCLDTENNCSIKSFYMFIWKLFYAEYLLIPFVK